MIYLKVGDYIMADISKITLPNNSSYTIKDGSAIANITRNGTTFTATKRDGTTFTFTQQDDNTTYSAGSGLSLSGTTFNHSNNVTAATAGTSSVTSSVNGTIAIPYITYDSQGHITKSGTHTHTLTGYPEAYLTWGGQNFSASYGPIDAAMIGQLGANRFAFLKANGINIEYSTNAGSTWSDYSATDTQKTGLFGRGQAFYLGKHTTNGSSTLNDQLRVTIDTGVAQVYTTLNKIAIYMSSQGNTVQVKIEKALQNAPTNYSTHLDWTNINGWSGWNILNIASLVTYGNTPTSQYGRVRFIFKQTAITTTYSAASISQIMGFGGVGWTVPSNMAKDGHLYSYDNDQNAIFPAQITATQFNGPLNGNASTATKATQDESGNNIKTSYAASFSISDHIITLKNKNGESLGTVTVPDNNTTYTANTGIKLNGTVIQHTNAVTAGTAGTSSATSGSTLAVPYVTYDAQGHITATGTHTHTVTGFLTSSSSLDASKLTGTVPTSVLPSYVDDVLEYAAKANFPATGEEGKIYVDKTTNLTWRWGGSAYIEISPSLALGTTASTAAKGNHTHSFTPAGTIAVQTAGSTNNTLKPVTAKTVVTSATFNTVVTGGTTTDVPNISKKTVVTGVTPATVVTSVTKKTVVTGTSVANEVLSFTTGDSISSTTGASATVSTGDSVTVGTAIKAYTGLTTGAAGSATTGDSVTLGNAVTVKTGDAAYKFTGTAGTTGAPA